eukprot:gb/GECG01014550.1/.p1 GENE.gb/GECG01014550.1/~~gb/GECG01014550.1/.p1  ORF type:complete len:206 (+),score=16.96 gb/GECG01014550.1/:1-618(+)
MSVRILNRIEVEEPRQNGLKSVQDSKECTLHSVPVQINYSGPADIETKFPVSSASASHDEQPIMEDCPLRARFRGRLLDGKPVELPTNTVGVVFKDTTTASEQNGLGHGSLSGNKRERDMEFMNSDDSDDDAEEPNTTLTIGKRQWTQHKVFDKLNYWVHGTRPSNQDFIPGTFDIFKVADKVCNFRRFSSCLHLDSLMLDHYCS